MLNDPETCPVCGGDGRIIVSSNTSTCPGCRGSGRRKADVGFHDVTKTKPSHHHPANRAKGEKKTEPDTAAGRALVAEVQASGISDTDKAKLTQNILEYENEKGEMTKTFSRIIRKQIR